MLQLLVKPSSIMVSPISNKSGQLPVETARDAGHAQPVAPSDSLAPAPTTDSDLAGIPRRPRPPAADGNRFPKRMRGATGAIFQQSVLGMALSEIARWVEQAPPDREGDYLDAAKCIKACWKDARKTSLFLQDLRIVTLPPLPPHLEEVSLVDCQCLISPPDLRRCRQLKHLELLDCWQMEELPDLTKCTQLDELLIADCSLVTVPPDLRQCNQLKTLDMSGCLNLRSTPDLTSCKKLESLKLEGCGDLTAAPDLMQCRKLKILNMEACFRLQSTSDLTHCEKLEELNLASCSALTVAPDLTQCRKLKFLNMEGCFRLQSTSDLTHCAKLEELNLSSCSALTVAPDLTQCSELKKLEFSECSNLQSPPDLTQCEKLEVLYMQGCVALNEPPDVRWCPDLTELDIGDCSSLVTPPLLSAHADLSNVDMYNTPLTSFPANLLQLPSDCNVHLSLGNLSEAVRRDFMAAIEAVAPDQRPRLQFDMVGASPTLPVQPLHREAESWLPGSETVWQGLSRDPSADDFSAFLGRIRQTSEYRNERLRENVEGRVQALLRQLAKPDSLALRQLCFSQAGEAVTTCNDRIALTLLHLETACGVSKISAAAARGDYDQNPLVLLKQGAGMYHLQQLEDYARDKVATLRFVDEIEVHLGYLVALSGEFSLPVQMSTMLYPACSSVHEPEIAAARAQLQRCALKASPDPELVRFLSSWEPLVTQLQRPATAHLSRGHAQSVENEVAAEKSHLQEALGQLDSTTEDYARQVQGLQAQYNGIESTVATRRHSDAIVRLIAEALNA